MSARAERHPRSLVNIDLTDRDNLCDWHGEHVFRCHVNGLVLCDEDSQLN